MVHAWLFVYLRSQYGSDVDPQLGWGPYLTRIDLDSESAQAHINILWTTNSATPKWEVFQAQNIYWSGYKYCQGPDKSPDRGATGPCSTWSSWAAFHRTNNQIMLRMSPYTESAGWPNNISSYPKRFMYNKSYNHNQLIKERLNTPTMYVVCAIVYRQFDNTLIFLFMRCLIWIHNSCIHCKIHYNVFVVNKN